MSRLRALIVEDVVDMAPAIARELTAAGIDTEIASSGPHALDRCAKDPFDVVITDLRMRARETDGLDLLDALKRSDPNLPVLIMSGAGGVESAVEAMRRGAFHYLAKPFGPEAVRSLVERACRERTLALENETLRRSLRDSLAAHRLLGQSASMRQLRALIERVAGASSPVLISGETGTGKELVALAIHTDGVRGEKPFIPVNCAALPEPLLESELFGHARGAFTGATQTRRGLFVEADEGTLFLDEVGDLPLPLQGKLLRVLQSGEVRPVGSETSRVVDVRCIAATHKDLSLLVEKGLFREDLFFRLDVLRVPVPALRERADDIPLLIEHFLGKSLTRSPRSVLAGLEPAALDYLTQHGWPGNVRQLENLIERLVVTASTPLAPVDEVRTALAGVREGDPLAALLRQPPTLEALESRYIAAVLQKVGGNKAKAAEILGIDLSTLYRREKTRI
jgi:two-component system response regulator HydG